MQIVYRNVSTYPIRLIPLQCCSETLTAVTGNRTTVADNSYRSIDLHDVSAFKFYGIVETRGFAGRLAW